MVVAVSQQRSVEWLLKRVWNRSVAVFFGTAVIGKLITATLSLVWGAVIVTLSCLLLSLLLISQMARFLHKYVPSKWCHLTNYFRTADLEVYASLRCAFSRFSSKLNRLRSSHPPILFLHGMNSFGQTGHWLLNHLNPFGRVYDINMGTDNHLAYKVDYQAEIERCAELVMLKIQEIFEETGHTQITLIGHSRGGVVANYLATSLLKEHVKRVITLGTPLRRPHQNGHGAHFFKTLNHAMVHEAKARFLHIRGDGDLITSEESFLPQGEHHHIDLINMQDLGHISILYSEEVLKKIVHALINDTTAPLERQSA